jgi:hypothetical protein
MKKLLQAAVLAGLLGLSSIAIVRQAQQPADPAGPSPAGLENGAIMYAELSKTLDAKKAKAGDPVTAHLVADVVAHGKIVAHRDSKLIGHVTEAQAFTRENPESRLGIVFDKVILKGGQEVPVLSMLLAIRPAPRIAFDVPSAPAPPGINPASGPAPERHYPSPKGPSPKMTTDKKDNDLSLDLKNHNQEMSGMGPTDIEGLSLSTGAGGNGQAIVSFKRNVKLESGVRLDLRVKDVPQ